MEKRNWKYKINGGWPAFILSFIMLVLVGSLTVRLYATRNSAFIGGLLVTGFLAIGFLLSLCSVLFFKVYVDKDGFFCQTAPGNGRYYRYAEIRRMWLSSGRETNAHQAAYCNFETVQGKHVRFLVLGFQDDAVEYMMNQAEALGNRPTPSDSTPELVINGRTEAGSSIFPLVFSLIALFLVEKVLFSRNVLPLLRILPVVMALVPAVQALFYGLFYEIKIQKDGFYCRTNPFNGRYYPYSDILSCRLVETRRRFGSAYRPGVRKTYYLYDFVFIDRAQQTHQISYNKALFEGEINELVARIEQAQSKKSTTESL